MISIPSHITTAQVVKLAEEHIQHFERLLKRYDLGDRSVRQEECYDYIALWTEIQHKGGKNLTEDEAREVWDAYDCGEYEHILGPVQEDHCEDDFE